MLAAARPTDWQGTFAARSALISLTPAQRHDQEYQTRVGFNQHASRHAAQPKKIQQFSD
jgi:hypothetical protein